MYHSVISRLSHMLSQKHTYFMYYDNDCVNIKVLSGPPDTILSFLDLDHYNSILGGRSLAITPETFTYTIERYKI